MRTSARGLRLIATFEGLRLKAYKSVAGERYWTIGYGHYGPDVKRGQTISRTRALALLRGDVRQAEQAIERLVKVGINQNRFDALVSFVFNCGTGAFAGSTLLRKLNQGHYGSVPGELAKWVRGADGPLAGLVRRRKAEAVLWRTLARKDGD